MCSAIRLVLIIPYPCLKFSEPIIWIRIIVACLAKFTDKMLLVSDVIRNDCASLQINADILICLLLLLLSNDASTYNIQLPWSKQKYNVVFRTKNVDKTMPEL